MDWKFAAKAGKDPEAARYRKTDAVHEGRDKHFMTLDSWNQDGNYQAREDEFGPEMEQEAPPTINGKLMEP